MWHPFCTTHRVGEPFGLSAVTTVQVGSQISGIISKLYADFNSQVKKGQILAELDPTPFIQAVEQRQADVTRSQVEVANAQLTYGRQKRLDDAGLIAQSELDAAKLAYDSSRAALAQSQASLNQAKTKPRLREDLLADRRPGGGPPV